MDKNSGTRENEVMQNESRKDRLFTKGSMLSALLGGVAFLIWSFVSMHLPYSTFSKADVGGDNVTEFVQRVAMSFFMYGLIVGMVAHHLSRSRKKEQILKWLAITGACGASAGAAVGAVVPLESLGSGLSRLSNGRAISIVALAIRLCVIAGGISVLFMSTRRRAILKSVFFSMALAWTLRTLVFSFVPINLHAFQWPWMVLSVVDAGGGGDAGLPFVVGIVVACVRRFGKKSA